MKKLNKFEKTIGLNPRKLLGGMDNFYFGLGLRVAMMVGLSLSAVGEITNMRRCYSTLTSPLLELETTNIKNNNLIDSNNNNLIKDKLEKIDPNYISGLTQADGSFICGISIVTNKKSQTLKFKPKFDLCLDKDSINALKAIQKYFGCGKISEIRADNSVHFIVESLKDLKNIIIPHFLNYPVFFNKLHAFQLLVEIVNLMNDKKDLRDKAKLLRLSISMNKSSRRTPEQITKLYSILGIPSCQTPPKIEDNIKTITSEITPPFLAGMIDGDGSFYIIFTQNLKIIPAMKQCYGSNCVPFEDIFKKYFGDIGQIKVQDNLRI
jgi:LAGLIDADG endonuclease